jgi:cytochrome c oxidase assembly factor CtaG|nr:cytochrome c oxidase assembly protein [Neorhizobium tomejilense]
MPALITSLLFVLLTAKAYAHGSESHNALSWTFDPWIVSPLLAMALLYASGAMRLRLRRRRTVEAVRRSLWFFWSGLAVLVLALVSPVHELGEHLFTAHMIEHELVIGIAAPLLVLAKPAAMMLWGLPEPLRQAAGAAMGRTASRALWRRLTAPVVATSLHGLAIWIWHYPPLFDATVSDVLMHRLQHLSFLGTAILFWWAMIWRARRGAAAWHQFVTMLHTTILGALIALVPTVLYRAQTRYAFEWDMTPLEDQQLAGIIMWVPGGIIYAGAALWFLKTWIQEASKGGANAERARLA